MKMMITLPPSLLVPDPGARRCGAQQVCLGAVALIGQKHGGVPRVPPDHHVLEVTATMTITKSV